MLAYFWLLFQATFIVAIGSLVGSWAESLVRGSLSRTDLDPVVRRLIADWVRPLVIFIAVLASLNHLGVNLTAAIAVLGAGTLAIGLAMQSSLSNVAAGALLLTTRPYRGGETVQVAGQLGTLIEMTLFHTMIKTADGLIIVVPNSKVLGDAITNYSENGQRRIDLVIAVEGKANIDKVEEIMLAALAADTRVLEEPAPSFVVLGVLPYGVQVRASGWALNEDFGETKTQALRAVLAGLKKSRIALATTARSEA